MVGQGANVRRLFLFAATGGTAALLPGTRVGELRVQADEITGAELVSQGSDKVGVVLVEWYSLR